MTKNEIKALLKNSTFKELRANLKIIKSSKYLIYFIIWYVKYRKYQVNKELSYIKHKIFLDKKDSTVKRTLLKTFIDDKCLKEDIEKDNLHYHMFDNPSSYYLNVYTRYNELKGRLKELNDLHEFLKSLLYYIENR